MMMGFGGIFGILLIGVVIWAVVQMTRNNGSNPFTTHQQPPTADKEGAVDILEKRYAKGEINKEEFESMKHELTH